MRNISYKPKDLYPSAPALPTEVTVGKVPEERIDKGRRGLIVLLGLAGAGAAVATVMSPAARDFFKSHNEDSAQFITAKYSNGKKFVEYGSNSYGVQYKSFVELVSNHEINVNRINALSMPELIRQVNPNLDNLEVQTLTRIAEHLYHNPAFENLKEGETVRIPYNPKASTKVISELSRVPVLVKLEQILK